MTPTERHNAAQKAAAARWSAPAPLVTISGSPDRLLTIGDVEIECYVLEDGTRVITQGSMLTALGRSRRINTKPGDDAELPPVLRVQALRRFVSDALIEEARPIPFVTPSGSRANGYRAEVLPQICEAWLAARAAGELIPSQQPIARAAEIIVRGLAAVGIIALVDEATGYQEVRTKDALARILEAFVAKELQPWVRTFPPEFYRELFRLRGMDYNPQSVQRPQFFGGITNDIIYDRLAPGVREELKQAQKKADRKSGKMFQHLTGGIGYPKLREHLGSVVTLMKLSRDWQDFKAKLDLIHPSYSKNMPAPLWIDDGDFGL
jgi:hypothetical protein